MSITQAFRLCLLTSFLIFPFGALADNKLFSEEDFYRIIYSELLQIQSFGNVRVVLEGEDAKRIGLNEKDLTDVLKLKVKNNFANLPYKDQSDNIFEIANDKKRAETVGSIIIRVWVVESNYPIAYHIAILAGTFEKMDAYTDAVLGYGSKIDVPETVRTTVGELVESFAIKFFKARGEVDPNR